jgi:uncharacterized membrane protein YfcA
MPTDFYTLVYRVIDTILTPLVSLLVVLAFLYFIWGLVEFIRQAEDEGAREQGRQRMIWGVVGLFAIVSVWGLVNVLVETFNLDNTIPTPPKLTQVDVVR